MANLHSYPSIYNIGHKAIADLLTVPCNIEEKVDGSQFSFGVDDEGELHARSKGAQIVLDAPEGMFARAIESIKALAPMLKRGWTYRGEYLAKPKHNVLAYDRTPAGHIIIFDINDGDESYLAYEEKRAEAQRIGLECVQLIYSGMVTDIMMFRGFLETPSALGGQKVEGVVVKPVGYSMFGLDKKCLMGKFVSEAFKEVHQGEWRKANPVPSDMIESLIAQFRTPARWQKARQHLTELGALEGSPRDIGALMKEVPMDVEKECKEEILEHLWNFAWPKLRRGLTSGLPEWYKEELLKAQFEQEKVA